MISLVILGAMPLAVGWLLNWYMTIHPETFPPMFIIALVMILAWGCVSWRMNRKMMDTGAVMVAQNLIAAVMMILVTVQIIAGSFWENMIGILSQMFFMPTLYMGAVFFNWMGMFGIYFSCFVLMVLASFIGCKIAEK